jgi:apolipoprotein N-acyltransferase
MAYALLEISYTLVTLVLLTYFFLVSQKFEHSLIRSSKHWLLFGFIFNFYGLSWLYTVYPLIWMKPGILQFLGIALLHIIVTAVSSLGFLIVAFRTKLKVKEGYAPFLFAASLTLAEIVRSLLLSVLYLGEDSKINLTLTAGTLGNALSPTPLIEYAYFGGTFSLTFILGYLVYTLSTRWHRARYLLHTTCIILLLVPIHFFVQTKKVTAEIGIVTTNFRSYSDEEYASNVNIFKDQAKEVHTMTLSFSSSTKMIVYPEDTRYLSSISSEGLSELNEKFSGTLFIDGDTISYKEKLSNVTLFYYPKAERKLIRGKEFLLPFNEYIPHFFRPLFSLFITQENLDTYSQNHTYTPMYSKKTILLDETKIGTLLCSEILSYSLLNRLKQENPNIVFFQSRLNVFHNNPWFVMHERSFTKVAAAQLRTPIVSSVNGAPSFIVSPYGKVIKTLETGFSTSTYIFK